MNIAVVAPSEIPARRANTVQVMKMAQAFALTGHQVRLAYPTSQPHKATETGRDHLPSTSQKKMWDHLSHLYGLHYQFPVYPLKMSHALRRYDYSVRSVIWAHRWGANLIYTRLPQVSALASLLNIAVIFEIHDIPQGWMSPRLFRLYLKGRGAKRMVVITQALMDDLKSHFGAPDNPLFTIVAPDGVDLQRYTNIPNPVEARRSLVRTGRVGQPLRPDVFTVGYTGNLYHGRGTTLLLELAAHFPEIVFIIVGGEPGEVAALQSEVARIGFKNLILTGFIPNAELPDYQAACDVLVMPYQRRVAASSGGDISRYLSPMKAFEYMASGRAIISSDLPVLHEVLTDKNAVLIPADVIPDWVDALKELHDLPRLRAALAKQALKDVQQYTWEKRAERILSGIYL